MNNTEFFQQRIQGDGAMPASGMSGLARVMRQALRILTRRTPTELEIAIQKRQLEKKLRANGYDRRLAKIAVSGTYPDRSNPIKETS
jgi:hypothetical protein